MTERTPRPRQYPRQLVVQATEEQAGRVEADARLRGDGSKSAAHRRLLDLGILLANHLSEPDEVQADPVEVAALLHHAKAVR